VSELDELKARCLELEETNAQLTRINETLMDRVERDTDQKGSSFSLFQAAIALEAEVKERTAALSQAMDALEKTNRELHASNEAALAASRTKSTFLATMSHELRTPMNGVLGMVEILMSTDLDASQRASAGLVRESALSLLTILNDILDFSKIEAGQLIAESTPFDLRRSVEKAMQLLQPQITSKGLVATLEWAPRMPTAVIGDPTRFAQIITNLVGNAAKFTAVGRISVRASVREEDDSSVLAYFEVEDTGIGIREENLPRVFESFTQSDSSITRQFGGTGLGLAIVRRLCHLMGGDCGVRSEFGRGSCFWFTVRLVRDLTSTAPTPAGPRNSSYSASTAPGTLRPLDVLIVEDNRVNQTVVRGLLNTLGCTCVIAENGVDAVRMLTAPHGFDVVLMDCQMPEMDGLEATRRIRAHENEHAGRVPIIALTANAMVGDREACINAGMDDFLSKPFQRQELVLLLDRWCSD